jgi:hypothetical protein
MGVLEKQLALAIDRRLAVFAGKVRDGSLLSDEMQLRSASYLISEIMLPCCCMMSNKGRLQEVLGATQVFACNAPLIEKLATLVYDDLARCNGLG